jgi:hypothetical protein
MKLTTHPNLLFRIRITGGTPPLFLPWDSRTQENRKNYRRQNLPWRKSVCLLCFLPASRWFVAWSILRPWRWTRHVPPKRWLTFNGLHDVISQKRELFITNSVRASNPTEFTCFVFLKTSVSLHLHMHQTWNPGHFLFYFLIVSQ